ncbi:hypothetical protein [Paractinoplanes durhamensis]|uniref:hypothetical protein n=1 Tax=Paractinoplanes durhamensis TaxID=113563 RepID=UPI001EF37DAD|nr:hypothetical protein [Actinoplanes durhamensis]
MLTQSKDFGGLDLGASTTSLLFFGVILALVAREQILADRHGVASKGDGPHGGRRADFTWAAAGAAVIAITGGLIGATHTNTASTQAMDQVTITTTGAAAGGGTTATEQINPTTRLGNLSRFAVITGDLQAMVAHNDLAAGKTRAKDLEVSWDDAEAGLKPRDSAKWHQLDGEIDTVLTALRASNPTKADCAAGLTALMTTLNRYDGV